MAKFCSSCGKENTDDAKFCIRCGNLFDAVVGKNDQQAEAEQPAADKKEQQNSGSEFVQDPNPSRPAGAAGSKRKRVHFNVRSSHYQWFDFQNPIALILYCVAVLVVIVGFIYGIYFGIDRSDCYELNDYYTGFSFLTTLSCWLQAFVGGTLLVAVGEIINILQKILNKRDRPEE